MSTKGPYDFATKEAQYRGFSDEGLRWSARDAQQAAEAMRGADPAAELWYLDDMSTLLGELARRELVRKGVRRGSPGPRS